MEQNSDLWIDRLAGVGFSNTGGRLKRGAITWSFLPSVEIKNRKSQKLEFDTWSKLQS